MGPIAECSFVTQCTAENPSGLLLTLTINTTEVRPDGAFGVGISEYNPTTHFVNMSKSNNWQLVGLSWGPCDGGTYPFGIAIFRGYYTLANVSTAKNVLTYGFTFCVSHPDETAPSISPLASLVPESLPDFGQIYAINGNTINYTSSTVQGNTTSVVHPSSSTVNSLGSAEPAVYTIAAGDEWGDLTLLHFAVVAST